MIEAQPGDVLAVRNPGFGPTFVRIGEWLHGLPYGDNHVIVMHHYDGAGVPWGIQGEPGGVGWVDCRQVLSSKYTVTNVEQPKTPAQRAAVAGAVEQMLGTQYDWTGIAADACKDLGLPVLFASDWHGKGAPGHVVCSSLAAYAYARVGLAAPTAWDGSRYCQPGDWQKWAITKGWAAR